MGCPVCKSENLNHSPVGDCCNDCGWSYPGYWCERCKRYDVNEYHLRLPGRTLCRTYRKTKADFAPKPDKDKEE
jgi:hypothetical protein